MKNLRIIILITLSFFVAMDNKVFAQSGTMIDLGTLYSNTTVANGINDQGQVVGFSLSATGQTRAFLWENGVMTDLGTLGGDRAIANGINNRKQIVGQARTTSGQTHAFLWENGVMTDLGTIPGGGSSTAFGINDRGQVVGSSTIAPSGQHAFLWENGVMTDLGALPGGLSVARGINTRGQVVGISRFGSSGPNLAFLWENGVMTDLGTLPGGNESLAYSINNRGQIVGQARNASGQLNAFLWENGVMINLGTLPGGGSSNALGINDQGQTVGFSTALGSGNHAFLWENGVMMDLGTFPGGSVSGANGINARGQVIGFSRIATGPTHAFLWSSSPSPSSLLIDYRFDDPADFANGVVRNYASPNYFGTIYGSRTYAPGVSGLSWEGNNIDAFTIIPGSGAINLAENGFTAEAVIMRYSNIDEDGFIEKANEFLLTIIPGNNNSALRFGVLFTDGTGAEYEYIIPDLNYLNNWTRITLSFSKNEFGSTAKFYINGNQVAEQFYAGKFMRKDNFPIGVGAQRYWARFNGRIDEVKIWTKELTKGQIAGK